MVKAVKLSEFGKNYSLKHIRLIRYFCFRCTDALTKNDLCAANFYQSRAQRVVKGINPFCKYLTEQDSKLLLETKDRLEKVFNRVAVLFLNGESNLIGNAIEEIIVETLDLEKEILHISLAQLSQKVLLENNQINYCHIGKLSERGRNE